MPNPTPTPKRPRGRPKKYEEATTTKTHRLTPTGHRWVLANKEKIEKMARVRKGDS